MYKKFRGVLALVVITITLCFCDQPNEPIKKTDYEFEVNIHKNYHKHVLFRFKKNVDEKLLASIQLPHDELYIYDIYFTARDTIIYLSKDTTVTQDVTIDFKKTDGQLLDSKRITVEQADTTSHDFVWTYKKFASDLGTTSIRDVEVVDANNIWAVSDLAVPDTNGRTKYSSLIHYNGSTWEEKYIYLMFPDNFGSYLRPDGIFVFDDKTIAIVNSGVHFFDGEKITKSIYPNKEYSPNNYAFKNLESPRDVWGFSANNFYVFGTKGGLAHWDGYRWKKIETNTDTQITDVYGYIDPVTGEKVVYVTATTIFAGFVNQSFKIINDEYTEPVFQHIDWSNHAVFSIYCPDDYTLYFGGTKIWTQRTSGVFQETYVPDLFSMVGSIRGNGVDDILLGGDGNTLIHFNGSTWKSYKMEIPSFYLRFNEVSVKENTAAAVAVDGRNAYFFVGNR